MWSESSIKHQIQMGLDLFYAQLWGLDCMIVNLMSRK